MVSALTVHSQDTDRAKLFPTCHIPKLQFKKPKEMERKEVGLNSFLFGLFGIYNENNQTSNSVYLYNIG